MVSILRYVLFPISAINLALSFIVLVFPISIIATPLSWQHRRNLTGPFWKLFGYIALKLVCLANVYKEDRRPKEEQGRGSPAGLYIANHQSFIDIPLMLTSIQIPPIMKKEILYIPLLGICGYSSGAIIVDRKDPESRKKVFQEARKRLLHYDKSLQYYPEGTRQRQNKGPKDISELKTPLMQFAYENKIKIYPISLYGTRKVLNEKTGLINYGKKIGSIFHSPLDPNEYNDHQDFIQAAWRKVQEGYYELEEKLN